MKKATTTLAAVAASATAFAVGYAPQYIDGLTFGEALKAMRIVGGSSNAHALMTFSTENSEALAIACVTFAAFAVYTAAKK